MMEILTILAAVVVVMLIAARFEKTAVPSDRTAPGVAENYSGLNDDGSSDPTNAFMVGNIWHDDD